MVSPRYTADYRKDELALICQYAWRGESLCFVGVAGTGKSNIVRILRYSDEMKSQYLRGNVAGVLFPVVDATTWDQTPRGLLGLLVNALDGVTAHLPPVPEPKVTALDDVERTMRKLQTELRWLCEHHDLRIMFILDDCDDVLRLGPLHMLERLNTLRSAHCREHLSYLLFTKKLPHVLGRAHHLEEKSKTYDLFKLNVFALRLYKPDDTRQMLKHLNELAGHPLGRDALARVGWLSGGHARLTKVLFEEWVQYPPDTGDLVSYFSFLPTVMRECARLFHGLHAQEQVVARRLARGRILNADQLTIDHLIRRGLVTIGPDGKGTWFSPLCENYLRTEKG